MEVIKALLGLDFSTCFLRYWRLRPFTGHSEAFSLIRFMGSSDELEIIEYLIGMWGWSLGSWGKARSSWEGENMSWTSTLKQISFPSFHACPCVWCDYIWWSPKQLLPIFVSSFSVYILCEAIYKAKFEQNSFKWNFSCLWVDMHVRIFLAPLGKSNLWS